MPLHGTEVLQGLIGSIHAAEPRRRKTTGVVMQHCCRARRDDNLSSICRGQDVREGPKENMKRSIHDQIALEMCLTGYTIRTHRYSDTSQSHTASINVSCCGRVLYLVCRVVSIIILLLISSGLTYELSAS